MLLQVQNKILLTPQIQLKHIDSIKIDTSSVKTDLKDEVNNLKDVIITVS